MSAADIVGYDFRASRFCPEHIAESFLAAFDETDRPSLPNGRPMPVRYLSDRWAEIALDMLAAHYGIADRGDERSFDSGDFPKVIFRGSLDEDPEHCEHCETELGA